MKPRAEGFLTGSDYLAVVGRLHMLLQPETYFKVGNNTGPSLGLANCASIAVGPQLTIEANFIADEPSLFFQMPSDWFFSSQNPVALFG